VTASASGVGPLTETATVTVVGGSAAQLAFTVQPTTTKAGATIKPAVQVSALDTFGNVATTFTGAVTLTLTGGDPLATLSGARTVSAVAGIATFSALSVNRANDNVGLYFLNAAASVTGATSTGFNVH